MQRLQPALSSRGFLEKNMRSSANRFFAAAIAAIGLTLPASMAIAQDARFHNAPASSRQLKNPYSASPSGNDGKLLLT
jgi:hypothetical protein